MSKQLLESISSNVEKIREGVNEVNIKVSKVEVNVDQNTEDLKEHMRRTELNEDRIYRLEKIEQWLRGAAWITIGLLSAGAAIIKLFKIKL